MMHQLKLARFIYASGKPLILARPFSITRIFNYAAENNDLNQADRFRSQETVFNPTRSKEVFQNQVETTEIGHGLSGNDKPRNNINGESIQNQQDADHMAAYNSCDQTVSLNACMQTNVPEPFQITGKAPVHLNMPGGAYSQNQKYLSEQRQNAHQHHQGQIENPKNHNSE